MKKEPIIGFAELAVSNRKIKTEFFDQINQLIDWRTVEKLINRYYQKGDSVVGRPSYSGLMLFKITLLQTWYGLSDCEVEDQVRDRISFSHFVGISLDDSVPDHSVISRFRTAVTKANAYDKLLSEINKQLQSKHILVTTGVIVDASITDTLRKPRGKKEHLIVEDRNEESGEKEPRLEAKVKPNVDTDGRWVKKAGRFRFGFKQHTAVDENGLVVSVVTTAANESDTKYLNEVLSKIELPPRAWVMADKGYKSKSNDDILPPKRLKNRIMRKANRGKPLTDRERMVNKAISRIRYKVERTFGSMVSWFGAGVARYVGIAKMHTQHLMQAIAYNLYRAPRIVLPDSRK